MSRLPRPWRALRNAYAHRLSWKLALSHLTVAMICQVIYLVGAILLLFLVRRTTATQDNLPSRSTEMIESTRILATILAGTLPDQASPELSTILARLPPARATGYGALDGLLSPTNVLVVVAPDGMVRAASNVQVPLDTPASTLEPPAWGQVLTAALNGERDTASPNLNRRDTGMRVLVSAYPLIAADGQVLGALGVRSARVPTSQPESLWIILASLSAIFLALLAIIGLISSVTSSAAGFLLARAFARRLRPLEIATEGIARGDLSGRVAITDRDEIGRLGERFNLLTARLEENERARRAFVSNISHELRTPLAIVRGHVEAQLAGGDHAAPPREALAAIDRETQALGGLIDDFFTLTRIEESALPLQREAVDLHEIAAAAVAGIRPLARARGHIAVESVVPRGLPPAVADPTRLSQILNNLLHNALRHTPDGGVIIIEAAPTADGAALEIGVIDTGTGIAPADLPHIFDRFYRGEQGTRQDGSSGLGLAIVKQLVEAQGGTVRAESTLGEGTAIRFTLPVRVGGLRGPQAIQPRL